MTRTRIIGKKAEDIACRFLIKNGLTLITRNYHCRYGEIDLIMQDGDNLVFVEVRYRRSDKFGGATESVSHTKQRKLVFAANHYLHTYPTSLAMRFDVIAISGHQEIEWITNAFMEN